MSPECVCMLDKTMDKCVNISYLQVARSVYNHQQAEIVTTIKSEGRSVCLAGDGRADSSGHSALFGVYTFMDTLTGKVLCFELVKVKALVCT